VVIMDRGFDPVAPVIHDWTYEPLVYDLLAPAGSVFKYHAQTQGGERSASGCCRRHTLLC
jgi:syntaxin-binding protein 1